MRRQSTQPTPLRHQSTPSTPKTLLSQHPIDNTYVKIHSRRNSVVQENLRDSPSQRLRTCKSLSLNEFLSDSDYRKWKHPTTIERTTKTINSGGVTSNKRLLDLRKATYRSPSLDAKTMKSKLGCYQRATDQSIRQSSIDPFASGAEDVEATEIYQSNDIYDTNMNLKKDERNAECSPQGVNIPKSLDHNIKTLKSRSGSRSTAQRGQPLRNSQASFTHNFNLSNVSFEDTTKTYNVNLQGSHKGNQSHPYLNFMNQSSLSGTGLSSTGLWFNLILAQKKPLEDISPAHFNQKYQHQTIEEKMQEVLSKYMNTSKRQQSSEYQTLKDISENLSSKIDTFQHQLQHIRHFKQSPFQNQGTQTEEGFLDDECQVTEQQEQIDDLKYQLIKLSDKIKQAELAHNNQENTLNEKVRVYKEQIKTLQEDLIRIQEVLRLRKDYEHSEKLNHEAIMQNKDQIIKQLTNKLQDSTKIIQELKTKNKKLVDRYQDLDHAQAQKSEEQIAMVMQKEKENIEKVKSMMQSRIEQYKAEVEQLKGENTSIRYYFEENQQSSMKELITVNEQFKSQLDIKCNQVKEQRETISLLEQEANDYKMERDSLQEDNSGYRDELSSLKSLNQELSNQVLNLEKTVLEYKESQGQAENASESDLKALSFQMEAKQAEVQQLKLTIQSQKKEADELKEQLMRQSQQNEKEIIELESKLHELQQESQQCQNTSEDFETVKAQHAQQISHLQQEKEQLREEHQHAIADRESNILELQQRLASQDSELKTIQSQVTKKDKDLQDLKQQNEAILGERDGLHRKLEDLVSQSTTVTQVEQEEKEDLKSKLDASTSAVVGLKSQLQDLEQTIDEYQEVFRMHESDIKELNHSIGQQKEEAAQANKQVKQRDNEILTLNSKNKNLEQQLQRKTNQLQKENKTLQEKAQALQEQLTQVGTAEEEIKQQLKQRELEINEVRAKYESDIQAMGNIFQTERADLQTQIEKTNSQLEMKETECKTLQDQVQKVSESFQQELSVKEVAIKELKDQLQTSQTSLKKKEGEFQDTKRELLNISSQFSNNESKQSEFVQSLMAEVQDFKTQLSQKEAELVQLTEVMQNKQVQFHEEKQQLQLKIEGQRKQIADFELAAKLQADSMAKETQEAHKREEALDLKEQEVRRLLEVNQVLEHKVSGLGKQQEDKQTDHEKVKQQLMSECKAFQEECAQLKKRQQQDQEQQEALKQASSRQDASIQELQSAVTIQEEKISQFRDQANKAQKEVQSQEHELEKLRKELESIGHELLQEQTNMSQLMEQHAKELERLKLNGQEQTDSQLQQLQALLSQQTVEKEQSEAKLKSKINHLEGELRAAQAEFNLEIKDKCNELHQLTKDLEAKDSQLTEKKAQYEALQEKLLSNTQQSSSQETLYAQEKTEKEQVVSQLEEAKSSIATKEKNIRQLEDQLNQLQDQMGETVQSLGNQIQHKEKQSQLAIKEYQKEIQALTKQLAKANILQEQISGLEYQNTELKQSNKQREDEVAQLKQNLKSRDQEIQDFFETDFKLLDEKTKKQEEQLKHAAEKTKSLEQQISELAKQNATLVSQQSKATGDQQKLVLEELKKKNQMVMVREAEIESLKKYVKELRETIDNEDLSKDLQEMKKSYSFATKEKEMKDIMIGQLKHELEKYAGQVMSAKEQEAQLAATINSLTKQLELLSTPKSSRTPSGRK